MKKGQDKWRKPLRRMLALLMATMTMWLLSLTAGTSSAQEALRIFSENTDLVSAALAAEVGARAPSDGEALPLWQRALLSQAPSLTAATSVPTDELPAELPQQSHAAEGDAEDVQILPPLPPQGIAVAQTMTADGSDFLADGVYIENRSGLTLDVAALADAKVELTLPKDGPQILIMHTHGSEAYTPDGADVYEATDTSRTLNSAQNMLRVGAEMQQEFEALGLSVVHDETLYDYPHYAGAYDRALVGVQAYLEQYPSIRVVLDVHRDALIGADGTIYKPVTTIDSVPMAQVLLVLGSDARGLLHPTWQKNLRLAMTVQTQLDAAHPTLARPIILRENRFNQHLTTGSMLVEVGSHGNTLAEALAAARLFAQDAGKVFLRGLPAVG